MIQNDSSHELIVPNEDLSFKIFLFEGKDGNYFRDRHWHWSVEIFAVLEGEVDFFLEDTRLHLTVGRFVLINSNEVHSIHALRPNRAVVLQIPVNTFHKYNQNNSFIYFSHNRQDADEEIMSLVREIYTTYQEKQLGYELAVQSRFYQLLYLLILNYRDVKAGEQSWASLRNQNKLAAITDYIKENYNQKLTLDQLGSEFGYSSTYISKMFTKYTGFSFKKYLENIRLAYAVQDLEQGTDTLDVIAAKHGFPDRKALNKAFQDKYHTSPRRYWRYRSS